MRTMLKFSREGIPKMMQIEPVGDYVKVKEMNSLYINLSRQLNLVIIRGSLNGEKHQYKFQDLILKIKEHLLDTNLLNIYIKLNTYDVKGISQLFSLSPAINEAIKRDKYITIYWNTMRIEAVNKIASYFEEKLKCDINICDI